MLSVGEEKTDEGREIASHQGFLLALEKNPHYLDGLVEELLEVRLSRKGTDDLERHLELSLIHI